MYLIINQLLKFLKNARNLTCILWVLLGTTVFAQTWPTDTIQVQINTNNPAFPFPQFLEYDQGASLAKNNAVGVTHADMEKAMREAYQIMMHRALKVPGKVLNGVQYMQYNNATVPQNYGTFVSEGDGYALLAAAYFADKPTFDGLWAWIHDNRLSGITKYYDCLPLRAGYPYGAGFAGWQCTDADGVGATSINSAGDGDVDIAMALLIASKQWPTGGITDGCATLRTYKSEALKMIKVLVDTLYYTTSPFGAQAGVKGYLSGIVGIDGYIKSGNTWGEVTNWRYSAANTTYPWALPKPDPIQVNSPYVDYNAPAYFEEFATFLAANGGTPWQISQCKRCAGSGDWTIGQMYSKGYIASAGNYSVSDNGATTTFGSFSAGEDFRMAWRTILNYVWHGNPSTTWNATTHQLVTGSNTFEFDMALRHKEFLKFPNSLPSTSANAFCSKLGASPDPGQPNWKGVAQIKQQYAPNGSVLANYGVNWMVGTGMPAAVASADLDLIAELYRQCEIEWDDQSGSQTLPDYQRYIGSTPKYFHGWFRTLGMLTASGNLHAPDKMVAAANVKVYMAVDKTFAYEGDIINYQVSYRNYGSVDATGVNITTTIDPNYTIVSVSNGGVMSGNTITWNIGTVTGFKTNGLAATMGTRTFVVKVNPISAATVVCLTSTVNASNAPSWTSNEYPNNASYTMERNCVDLLKDRVLAIQKTTDRSVMNSGDIVNFTLNFQNKTGSNLWLDGGRDRVLLSYANWDGGTGFYQFYRIWHTAQEAYINLGNYRVSYFMNDAAAIGKYDAATNPTGWDTYVDNQSDLDKYGYNPLTLPVNQQLKFTYQKIPWGSDANGAWNQRVITQFANVLSAPTTHIFDKLDSEYLIHKGVTGPGFTRTRFESKPSSTLAPRLADDWSFDPTAKSGSLDGQGYYFFPVTPSYTNATTIPRFAPVLVNNYSKDACGGPVQNFAKVLFEEFDGYTWRRIAGNGPLPGRETYNVTVTDSIPIQLSWNGFTNAVTIGVTATYTALTANPKFSGYVKWTIPVMLTGDIGKLTYSTIAKSPCVEKTFINAGWIWSDVDSPDSSVVHLKLTCNPVPPTPPIQTSLVKTADKTNVVVGDVVTYTLTYTNVDGSTASWAGASTVATDWQTLGTNVTIPILNGTVISLDQNGGNNAPGANGYSFGPKKAHGVNGWVEATIATTNSSNLSFLYRYQSPTQNLRLEISPNIGGNNNIAFTLYQNGAVFATLTGLAFPGSSSSIKIRTQLLNDKLYIWINDFTGAPLKVISGITQLGAGFAGIYGNGSQQALSAYTAHFDSAFDLFISDPVPAQLNNIVNISNSGILTGSTIAWPTIPGPILANVVTTRTFQATVNTCADFITNIGNATVYGISNIQSQYVITCGGVTLPTCTPPTTVTVTTSKPALCKGAALTVKGSASPANANYFYTWYRNGVAITTASKTYADYIKAASVVSDSGTYVLRVEDGNAGSATCYKENSIKIRIDTVARAGKISSSQELCLGSTALALTGTASTGGIAVKNYKWQDSTKAGSWSDIAAFAPTATGLPLGIPTTTTYYRRIDSSGVCVSAITNVDTIRVNNIPLLGKITPVLKDTLCAGADFNLSTSIKLSDSTGVHASKNGGYYFTWEHLRAGVVVSTSTPLPYRNLLTPTRAVSLADSGLYRLIVQDGIGATKCQDTLTIRIVVNQAPTTKASIAKHQEICKGDAASTITEVDAASGYAGSLYTQWYTTKDTTGTPILTKILNASTGINYDPGSPTITEYYVRKDSVQYCSAVATNFIKVRVNNSLKTDTILPLEGDTLCVSAGSNFQLKGVVDSLGNSSINGGYYFTWMQLQKPSTVAVVVGTPGKYVDYPPTSRLAELSDSGTYYLIVRDGVGATKCADTLKAKVVVIPTCTIIIPTCKKPVLVSTTLVGKDTLCVGNTFTIKKNVIDTSAGPSLSGYYFSWLRINSAGSVVVYAASRTYADLVVSNVSQADSGRYYLIVEDGNGNKTACKETSAAISIVVNAPLTIPVVSSSDTICSGSVPSLFTGTIQASGTYQWYASSDSFKTAGSVQKLTGSTLSSYQSGALTTSVYFMRKDSVAACASVSSNILTLQVDQQITAGTIAKDTTICSGGTIHLRGLTVPTGGKPLYTYGWERSTTSLTTGFSSVTGTDTFYVFNNSVIATQLASGTYYFRRSVTDVSTCSKVYSAGVAVKITSGLVQSPNASDSLKVCSNTTPTISGPAANASNATNPGALNYQWQIRNGLGVFVNVPSGGTSLSYVVPSALTSDTMYRRISAAGVSACDSGIVKVYIKVYKPLKGGKLQHAGAGPICRGIGTSVALKDSVSISGGGGLNTISWEKYNPATLNWDVISGSSKDNSYTTVLLDSVDFMIRRKVVDGTCSSTAYSDTVTVKVNDLKVSLNDPGTLCVGKNAILTAQSNIPGTTFVWTVDGSTAVGSSNSGIYTYTGVFADSNKVLKVVVTTAGNCTNSAQVRLKIVKAVAPTVSISTPYNPICEGYPIKFLAAAKDTGSTPTYQWYQIPFGSTTAQQVGTNNASYASTALAKGDQVYVEVTSSLSCALLPNPAKSTPITMNILPVPAPIIVEQNDTLCVPGTPNSKVFSLIVPTGNTVQWYQNGSPIAGETNSSYTASKAGTYSVQESNAACNAISSSRTLTLIATPIANAGADVYLAEGAVSALDGSGGAIYSWSPATYLSNDNTSDPSYKATQTIGYELTVSDATGKCKSKDDVIVYVVKPIIVPNVITVNGDGVNDTWEIENIHGYPNSIIEIYNRWGNLVWKAEGYPKNWDGTNFRNGEVLPDGTYFYIIHLHSDVYPEPHTGWVQIIK
jgi:gliding motility-associated-like protein/uncharacterized repeat protein (TIGR01451 family)